MRKVILGLAISLDGFIEGPNGEYDWCFNDQDYGLNDFFSRVDTIFIGRKSYEMAQQHADNNNGEVVPGMPRMKEYVFSNTLRQVKEGAILVAGDSIAEVRKIKEQAGKDIWLFGGASLTDAFMREGLVDELWLSVHPIILGAGKPLFHPQENRTRLTLLDSKTYNTGLVSLWYKIG
ncbi:dihydrofolate reductase family protein [Chitinophaga pinensis]|uniref:Bifunctional deaminase-reductase domain protein n=1 Tax=Chitinophaga pinensis (strain ATCC 43595 / DSM 2588 / LMG 13176 / NBRC 15968 / NCIMB 11800 / UQM 2034) TaxID=485918 RepID=A0A979GB28_CHIPD|nr:dihydrofolate reductase family protein [Chitinophaga pinensis]ACU64094.1 bifunctional deaminase-reductase domain protein [Chitinophaga pinensis DSM 2588]